MAYSMTGFGHDELMLDGAKVSCDIKTVNSRYCDVQVHMPRAYMALDSQIRSICKERLRRGKVDVVIRIDFEEEEGRRIFCDIPLAEAYKVAMEELGAVLERPYIANVKDLIALDGVLRSEEVEIASNECGDLILQTVNLAIDSLLDMREEEGFRLSQDILQKADSLLNYCEKISQRAYTAIDEYKEKLQAKLDLLFGEKMPEFVDSKRIEAELVLYADKVGIDEELTRLDSHLQSLKDTVVLQDVVGKKLDFLMQEINREVNTIGSKANDLTIAALVVEMKAENEKIREQVQNLV